MAFKSLKEFNESRYGGWFLLRNDGDHADVTFLYRNVNDVLMAEVHYIKTPEYSGYVHCTGRGCPACAKKIRVQSKLFIPVYNFDANEVQFWDRGSRFEQQFTSAVLEKHPNPSEVVFTVTRHGEAGSKDTRYAIAGKARNNILPYDVVLAHNNITFPDGYSAICKEFTSDQLYALLNSSESSAPTVDNMPDYQVTPRTSYAASVDNLPEIPSTPDLGALPDYKPAESSSLPVSSAVPTLSDEELLAKSQLTEDDMPPEVDF